MAVSGSGKYPYPSEVRVGDYVLVKLTDFNYSIWRPMILDLIQSNGLIGFINGAIAPPPQRIGISEGVEGEKKEVDAPNPEFWEWKRTDDLLRRWILQMLNADMLARVAHMATAREVWSALEFSLFHPLSNTPQIYSNEEVEGFDLSKYLPLFRAALNGDWPAAENIFKKEPTAAHTFISGASETALMVAARTSKRNNFMRRLLERMTPEEVAIKNCFGCTALHIAASAGNVDAARQLVKKNPNLPGIWDKSASLAIHLAAVCGRKEMVAYLLTVTRPDIEPKPFEGESGLRFVHGLLAGGIYDISLSLLKKYPSLAQSEFSPLRSVKLKHSAFKSGTHLYAWQRVIFPYIPIPIHEEELLIHQNGDDIESSSDVRIHKDELPTRHLEKVKENPAKSFLSVGQACNGIFWELVMRLVPQIRKVQETKVTHHQALKLVQYLCNEVAKLNFEKARLIFGNTLRMSACIGNHEVVEEILASFPSAVYLRTEIQQNVFHLAVVYRHVNVFNLIYQFQEQRYLPLSSPDALMNNALHLVGYMESEHLVGSPETQQKLNLRSSAAGAALQMQRELQWFKEVEKLSLPQDKEQRNTTGKTPKMIFTETHEELAKEGEQWMKDRANSSTIVAALVATVVFAAAITVPGGSGGSGLPIFRDQPAFVVFAVFDALALFASISSMLMFLGILTSRYAFEDFLHSLPKRFIIGLVMLFLSMLFMMAAFAAIVYLVFGDKKGWVLGLVSGMASLPVLLFALLQFRPLLEILGTTYGHGVFYKQSNRILF